LARRCRQKISGGSLGRILSPAMAKKCPNMNFAAACLTICKPSGDSRFAILFQGSQLIPKLPEGFFFF
jgi:hypothetical protein